MYYIVWNEHHFKFFLSHELTRNEQMTSSNRFFRESGRDDNVTCYALITCSQDAAFLLCEEDHISLLLKLKNPRRACFDIITKANSRTRTDILPTRISCFSHAHIFM